MSAASPRHPQPVLRWLKRAAALPLALLILFEEWGWEPLSRLMARIARWPLWAWAERRIQEFPPYAALAAFALPWLLLLPVKLLALGLVGQGRLLLGTAVIIVAKVIGTALLARLFALTKPALLRLAWFAVAYARWIGWKARLLAAVRASWAWRWGRVIRRDLRRQAARWREWLRH